MSNLILPEIKKPLENKFIKWEAVAEILSLGLAMKKPVILYGRGGHGKSEMVRAVFQSLSQSASDYGIQSFGEGMSEAKLFGGLNLKSLNCTENPRMEFAPENSFLAKKYYLFEELFDAPPVVLLALKDTLMSRQLNNGHQTYLMATELLVGATNKQPHEVSELGDSFQALTERFPLQLCVEWDSYKADDYMSLFNLVEMQDKDIHFVYSNNVKKILSQMIADAVAKGNWISPRQAVVALNTVKTVATINNRDIAKEEDLMGLKFIPGTEEMLKELSANLEKFKKISEAEEKISELEKQVSELEQKIEFYDKPISLLKVEKMLENLEKNSNISVPDQLVNRKNDAKKKIVLLLNKAHKKALDCTNLT